jgi:CBS domain-containing protein
MSPRTVGNSVIKEVPVLTTADSVETAARRLVETGCPALPVTGEGSRLLGVFGEREFIGALFPRYLGQLGYAGFVPDSLDDALEKRQACRAELVGEYMNTEHVDVERDFSDTQVAEIFLHHRVLIVPVTDEGRVHGVITRADFFRALAQRFLEHGVD